MRGGSTVGKGDAEERWYGVGGVWMFLDEDYL